MRKQQFTQMESKSVTRTSMWIILKWSSESNAVPWLVHNYHWVDTSVDGQLLPKSIISPVVSVSAFAAYFRAKKYTLCFSKTFSICHKKKVDINVLVRMTSFWNDLYWTKQLGSQINSTIYGSNKTKRA